MASIVSEIDALKGKMESWKSALEKADTPETKRAASEMSELLRYWDKNFPGSLKPVFKRLEDFTYYNSDFLFQSEALMTKQAELSKALAALGTWYKSH